MWKQDRVRWQRAAGWLIVPRDQSIYTIKNSDVTTRIIAALATGREADSGGWSPAPHHDEVELRICRAQGGQGNSSEDGSDHERKCS